MRAAQAKLDAANRGGKHGIMVGPKKRPDELILDLKDKFVRFFAPHTNTCFVFKFATDPFGQPSMQRNAAWSSSTPWSARTSCAPSTCSTRPPPPPSY